ncbi:hypothetical protein DFP72DRAFT_858424 [Ephemerocybe angulata]|uniref:Uncharacterized protein n=1 Tax=Ephemerocybe angulata TaxID=980116 RepID=A0A8H6HC80_9AGAR|nr:hypothetical protein DFP72DRAFT_858424 [Tulosesus angulatus]
MISGNAKDTTRQNNKIKTRYKRNGGTELRTRIRVTRGTRALPPHGIAGFDAHEAPTRNQITDFWVDRGLERDRMDARRPEDLYFAYFNGIYLTVSRTSPGPVQVPRAGTPSPVGHRTGFKAARADLSHSRLRETGNGSQMIYLRAGQSLIGLRDLQGNMSAAPKPERAKSRDYDFGLGGCGVVSSHSLPSVSSSGVIPVWWGGTPVLGFTSAVYSFDSSTQPLDFFLARFLLDLGLETSSRVFLPVMSEEVRESKCTRCAICLGIKGESCADFAENDLKINGDYPQEIFDALSKGWTTLKSPPNYWSSRSPYWLGNPNLGVKYSKLQSMLAIMAKRTKPGETPLVDPELRERLGAIVTKCRRIKEGKMLPGDMAVPTWRDGKSGASGGAGASRGTKRPSTGEAAPANKTRVVARSGGSSAVQNWRTPTQGPPNFYGLMCRTRELISTGDANSDGPEARVLGGLMAIRTQMFGLESQIDVMQELWTDLGRQHDAKTEELRDHLDDYESLAPRIAPADTVLPDDRVPSSRRAVAPTRRNELTEDRVVVNLRGTTRGPPPKALRESRSRVVKAIATPVAPKADTQVAVPLEAPVETPVASSSRDKGKARANPVRATRKKTWAEEVEAEDVRMVVSEGDEDDEDELESGDESDLSELPQGYRSD